jgi:hypothetical protein
MGVSTTFVITFITMTMPRTYGWLPPFGKALRTWALPPRVGTLSCMDSTSFGLVCGTTKGHLATFPVESNVAARTRLLSDGQALLHIHAQGVFVAGSFFDAVLGKYVVRLVDMNLQYDPFTVYHPTHVLGGGFVRVNMDLCYFSMSIDGFYVVSMGESCFTLLTVSAAPSTPSRVGQCQLWRGPSSSALRPVLMVVVLACVGVWGGGRRGRKRRMRRRKEECEIARTRTARNKRHGVHGHRKCRAGFSQQRRLPGVGPSSARMTFVRLRLQ